MSGVIRLARRGDLAALVELERAAGAVFRSVGMAAVADDEPPRLAELMAYQQDARAWIAADEADRPVGLVSCDPGPSVLLVSHQLGQAGWLVIGYRGHADRPEDGTRGALQLDERGQVAAAGKPDHTHLTCLQRFGPDRPHQPTNPFARAAASSVSSVRQDAPMDRQAAEARSFAVVEGDRTAW